MIKASKFASYYTGVASMGTIIGLLTGISASPVVSVLIPLLFGLITAGGGVYVMAGGAPSARASSMSGARERGRFLGFQMIFFTIAFLVGLWFGVAAKFHSDMVWPTSERTESAFEELAFDDMRVLAAFINLDTDMRRAGVPREKRLRILGELQGEIAARAERAESDGPTEQDIAAALAVIGAAASQEDENAQPWSWLRDPVAYDPSEEQKDSDLPKELRKESATG